MVSDHNNAIFAWFAATSPWWLPGLKDISDRAALILPIVAVTWFLLQITLKLHSHYRQK